MPRSHAPTARSTVKRSRAVARVLSNEDTGNGVSLPNLETNRQSQTFPISAFDKSYRSRGLAARHFLSPKAWDKMEYWILGIAALIMLIGGFFRDAHRKRESEVYEEKRRSMRRLIDQDPSNLAAYEFLGDNLRRAGYLDEAVKAYDEGLGHIDVHTSDTSVYHQILYKRNLAEKAIADRNHKPRLIQILMAPPRQFELVFCPSCGASNPTEAQNCDTCGTFLPVDNIIQAFGITVKDIGARRPLLEGLAMIVVVVVTLRIFALFPTDIRALVAISAGIVSISRLIWAR